MRKSGLLGLLVIGWLGLSGGVPQALAQYQETWTSLVMHPDPSWFDKGKFGIYAHWGPYSVPAFHSEWYPRNMYVPGSADYSHHAGEYGSPDRFGYKDFIPMFTAEAFDADAWALLYKQAGAKFAGPVAEHADGFSMWDSRLTEWNAKRMGPKRDVVGEMEKAVRAQGLRFLTSFHHQWLWGWYPTWNKGVDASDPRYVGLYGTATVPGAWNNDPLPDPAFQRLWLDKVKEVVDRYHPDMLWFDSRMYILADSVRRRMLAYHYNAALQRGQDVAATYKDDDFRAGAGFRDYERGGLAKKSVSKWLTDDSMDKGSWSWVEPPNLWSADHIIDELVDIVSKNGNLLLNIPPKANGEIAPAVRNTLLAIGTWLQTNGEAIYGTRPWRIFGEGPTSVNEGHFGNSPTFTPQDIRFTVKGRTLFAIVLGWPMAAQFSIAALKPGARYTLGKAITDVELLGSPGKLAWTTDGTGTRIQLPAKPPGPEYAYAFRIRFDGDTLGYLSWEKPWDRETWTEGDAQTLQWTQGGNGKDKVILEYGTAQDLCPIAVVRTAASSVFGGGNEGSRGADGSLDTRWASAAGSKTGQWLELEFAKAETFNRAVIREATDSGFNIAAFEVQYWTGSAWMAAASGTGAGPARGIDFPAVTASRVRLSVNSPGSIQVNEFEIYRPAFRIGAVPNTGSFTWTPDRPWPDSLRLRVASLDGRTEDISAAIAITRRSSRLAGRPDRSASREWIEGGLSLGISGQETWRLPYGGPGALAIFDIGGRLIRRIPVKGRAAAWDGRDGLGKPAAAGTCLWRVESGGSARNGKACLRGGAEG